MYIYGVSIDGCSLHAVGRRTEIFWDIYCYKIELVHVGVRSVMPNALSLVRLTAYLVLLNLASETVIFLELVKSKRMPILLYGLESCQLSNADLRSLDFTFNRLFMKLLNTKSIDVVIACQSFTGSKVPSCSLKKFIIKI